MRILLFDNYDSFTYNLYHLVEKLCDHKIDVRKNDQVTLEEIAAYDKIMISPGPGIPSEAGILLPMLKEYRDKKPILGVCLGHQAIGESFGAKLINLDKVYHGVATVVNVVKEDQLFDGLPEKFLVGRYHSWAIDPLSMPAELEITATSEDECVMALRHKTLDICGVQFHPESILTEYGEKLLHNWIRS